MYGSVRLINSFVFFYLSFIFSPCCFIVDLRIVVRCMKIYRSLVSHFLLMQYAKRYDAVSTLAGYKFNIFLLQALTSENLLILPYHAMSIKIIRSVRVHLV